MRRGHLDIKRFRLWVERLKISLSVEHPIAGDELRPSKRYLATHTDKLPWLFVSERQGQLTRQVVNYIVRLAGEKARLGRVWPHITWGTAIPSIRPTTHASLGIGSKAFGGDRANKSNLALGLRRHQGDCKMAQFIVDLMRSWLTPQAPFFRFATILDLRDGAAPQRLRISAFLAIHPASG